MRSIQHSTSALAQILAKSVHERSRTDQPCQKGSKGVRPDLSGSSPGLINPALSLRHWCNAGGANHLGASWESGGDMVEYNVLEEIVVDIVVARRLAEIVGRWRHN